MNCFFCKGTMHDDVTTYFTDLGKCMIIIKNVPCQKCAQCGETVFSGEVVAKIEQITDMLKNALTEIAVVDFQNNVA